MIQNRYGIVQVAKGVRPTKELVALWRGAVEATHSFLTPAEIDAIEPEVAPAIEDIEHLAVAFTHEGTPLAFIGVQGGKIEMLFVASISRGLGLGRALLEFARREWDAKTVDVNEQNEQGVGFYKAMGFTVQSRDDVDSAGRPYPILHMALGEENGGDVP